MAKKKTSTPKKPRGNVANVQGQKPERGGAVKNRGQQAAQSKRQEAPFPHFRRYKKSNHPALVVGEQVNDQNKEEYKFRKVMHGDRDGRHLNEKVEPNPDPTDPEPMYIAKRVRHDEKKHFDKKPLPWKYRGHKKK